MIDPMQMQDRSVDVSFWWASLSLACEKIGFHSMKETEHRVSMPRFVHGTLVIANDGPNQWTRISPYRQIQFFRIRSTRNNQFSCFQRVQPGVIDVVLGWKNKCSSARSSVREKTRGKMIIYTSFAWQKEMASSGKQLTTSNGASPTL